LSSIRTIGDKSFSGVRRCITHLFAISLWGLVMFTVVLIPAGGLETIVTVSANKAVVAVIFTA
jgi:hypothetical protein